MDSAALTGVLLGTRLFCVAVLGLRRHTGFSLAVEGGGYSLVAEHGLLFAVASLVDTRASIVVARVLSSCSSEALEHRLNNCGARAWLLHSMHDLCRSGIQPLPPALPGRFFTTKEALDSIF